MFVEFLKDREVTWRGELDQIPSIGDLISFDNEVQYTVYNRYWILLSDNKPEVTIYIH